ncbi:MAG TPA: DUF6338 family protein [Tepidisphaeraceae bacterium]|jgi:hypothetical protein
MDISAEAIDGLWRLLPGLLAAWVFHGLTPHEAKKEWWQRIVQALIFTVLIQAAMPIARSLAFAIGKLHSFGPWTHDTAVTWSCLLALVFGCLAAWCANSDKFHALLRRLKLTREISYPSNWCAAFSEYEWYVVLHLKGGQRLYGWPVVWPNRHDCDHFIISQPAWLLEDGEPVPMPQLRQVVVPAEDVTMVGQYESGIPIQSVDEIKVLQAPLVKLQRKERLYGRRKRSIRGNGQNAAASQAGIGPNVGTASECDADADANNGRHGG